MNKAPLSEPLRIGGLVYGIDEFVGEWVVRRLSVPGLESSNGLRPFRAIGVERDGCLVAGVVYHQFNPMRETMEVTIASDTPRWATKGVISRLLSYPFDDCGVYTLCGYVQHNNERALKFDVGIGFKKEGVLRHRFGRGKHAVSFSMIKPEYERRWKNVL